MAHITATIQNLDDGYSQDSNFQRLLEQLQAKCLAPDGSLALKKAYEERQKAAARMKTEKRSCFEVLVLLLEAEALLEDVRAAVDLGGPNEFEARHALLRADLKCAPQVYRALQNQLAIAEASQRLLLPAHRLTAAEEEGGHGGGSSGAAGRSSEGRAAEPTTPPGDSSVDAELLLRGAEDRMLGCNLEDLRSGSESLQESAQAAVLAELDGRLRGRLQGLASYWQIHLEAGGSRGVDLAPSSLVHEVEVAARDLERQQEGLLEDVGAHRRQARDYMRLLKSLLAMLLELAREYKLKHQPTFDEAKISWLHLKGQTLQLKLKVIESSVLEDTYQPHSVKALKIVRERLTQSLRETTSAYAKAEADLSMYRGVDPAFDRLARQYREYSARLEHLQWTIREVERDIRGLSAH